MRNPTPMSTSALRINIAEFKTACSSCGLRELCLPMGLSPSEMERVGELVSERRRVKRNHDLYLSEDRFNAIYAISTGFFKTSVILEDGREHVTGFNMAGDIIGLDGIGTDRHKCNATALEDSEVCVIPFSRLEEISNEVHGLQRQFHRMMSREIVRDHGIMTLLGSMRAEERLAAFLLNLSERLAARGYSPAEFNLRMSRDEIGSFLGLKLETISRLFSKFHEDGLVSVHLRHIRILDTAGLRKILNQRA
jgi:CRP/FNR family transcriptional regulator, anaerobic regulatory protein